MACQCEIYETCAVCRATTEPLAPPQAREEASTRLQIYADQLQRDWGCDHTNDFSDWCPLCRANVIADIATVTTDRAALLSEKAAAERARDEAQQERDAVTVANDRYVADNTKLHDEVARLTAQLQEAQQEIAHWKHCHGVTADALVAAESQLTALRGVEAYAISIKASIEKLLGIWRIRLGTYDYHSNVIGGGEEASITRNCAYALAHASGQALAAEAAALSAAPVDPQTKDTTP